MYIETQGYIYVKREKDLDKIEEICENKAVVCDRTDNEVIVEIDPGLLEEFKKAGYLSKSEINEAIDKCDSLRFYL